MNRRVIGFAVAVVAAVVLFQFWPSDRDPDPVVDLSVEDLAALDVGARELVALASRTPEGGIHAVYTGTGRTLEVWAVGERVREIAGEQSGTWSLTQRDGDEVVRCLDEGLGWECEQETARAGGDDTLLGGRVQQLTQDLALVTVSVTDDQIAGLDARCFAFSSETDDAELCLTLDGLVARMVVGSERLELELVDDEVSDADFVLPN